MAVTFQLRIVSHLGVVLLTLEGPSVRGLQQAADASPYKVEDAVIRAESTSDGTYWGIGRGRIMSERIGKGRWLDG